MKRTYHECDSEDCKYQIDRECTRRILTLSANGKDAGLCMTYDPKEAEEEVSRK